MLQHLTLGQYYPGESPIHRLDPRTKLCGALVLMAALIWVKALPLFFFMLAVVAALVRVSGVPLHLPMNNLKAFRLILIITFAAHACFTPGEAVIIAGYTVPGPTWEGMFQGAVFSLRLVVIMLIAALLMLTTAPLDVSDGIERLLKPLERFGLPAHELAMMMVIALRFIPTLVEEADRLQKAQAARGADFTGNPIRRVRENDRPAGAPDALGLPAGGGTGRRHGIPLLPGRRRTHPVPRHGPGPERLCGHCGRDSPARPRRGRQHHRPRRPSVLIHS